MKKHYTNLIVGGGPAGLYMAWRMSQQNIDDIAICEWSPVRVGGRIYTKTFEGGEFVELGGMRFSNKHYVLKEVISQLALNDHVVPFEMTTDRLYYLRGDHLNQSEIPKKSLPYKTEFSKYLPDELFKNIEKQVTDNKSPKTRAEWFDFFDNWTIPSSFKSKVYKQGDFIGNIGYWNLMFDQLGSEGFLYAADAGGYSSNVINSNAAYAIYSNSEFDLDQSYERLDQGYSLLFNTLEKECIKKSVVINKGQRLNEFCWNSNTKKFHCTFIEYDQNGGQTGIKTEVTSDKLLLCMPRHSLELIQENDVSGDSWPINKPRKVLKNSKVQYYIESVIQQPSYKIALM